MLNRRVLAFGLPLLLAGCGSFDPMNLSSLMPATRSGDYHLMYAALSDEPHPVPAIPLSRIDPTYLRHDVAYDTYEAPGTIIVDPADHFLYYVEGNGRAIRYGVGVGREGFAWSGTANVKWKQEWPKWFPPIEMQKRDPRTAAYANGMDGGPGNPLGARALYLFQGNKDTGYRIHGTIEPESIGKSMSSGCIRLLNQDIIDLFERVPAGTKVIVLPADGSGAV